MADGARVEDPDAVQLSPVEETLVEGRELLGGGDDVRRGNDAAQEARIVRELHRLVYACTQRASQQP